MKCLSFKSLRRGSILGFADLAMDSGLILKGCTLLESNNRRWVNPPGRPQLDGDRKVMVDDAGKLVYAVVIDFITKAVRSRWSAEAVAEIDEHIKSTKPAAAGSMSGDGAREAAKPGRPA